MVISLAFVKTLDSSGEKNEGLVKVGENKALVDVLGIQGDWSVTDGCFGLAAWPQQMLLWTLAHFPGLRCHLAYLVRPLFFTSLFQTGQS